jgi:hypothetical protein
MNEEETMSIEKYGDYLEQGVKQLSDSEEPYSPALFFATFM